jgi:predicted transcriptional regulator of viral defense system
MKGDWRTAASGAPNQTIREVRAAIERAGLEQKHLITLDQLKAAGLSPRGVRARVSAGRLHRVFRGVYCVHPPPHSLRQRYLATVLACGPGSYLSDLSAAHHVGMTERPASAIHVTNSSGAGRSLPGAVVHRRVVAAQDIVRPDGIWCTSPARTIIDCAAWVSQALLEDLLMAADATHSLDRARLEELIEERRGQPGMRKLQALITDEPVETRSINERRVLRICRRFGIPEPLVNHPIRVGERLFYADFCWSELNLIVEADSWRWHGGRLAGESDADRDQVLSMAGWKIVHFTRDQIKREADRTGRRLLTLTGTVAPLPSGS